MALHHDGRFDRLEDISTIWRLSLLKVLVEASVDEKTTGKEPVEDVLRFMTGKSGEFSAHHR